MTFHGGQEQFRRITEPAPHDVHPSLGRPIRIEDDPNPQRDAEAGERLSLHILKNIRHHITFLERSLTVRDFLPREGIASRTHQRLERAAEALLPGEIETAMQREYADIAWMLDVAPGEMSAHPAAKEAFLRTRLNSFIEGIAESGKAAPHSMRAFFDFTTVDELIPYLETFKKEDFSFSSEAGSVRDDERIDISLPNIADAVAHFKRVQVVLQTFRRPDMIGRGNVQERFEAGEALLKDAAKDVDLILRELSGKRIAGLRTQLVAGYKKEVEASRTFEDGGGVRRKVLKEERAEWDRKIGQVRALRSEIASFRKKLSGFTKTTHTVNRIFERFDIVHSLRSLPRTAIEAIKDKKNALDRAFASDDGRGIRPTDLPGITVNKQKFFTKLDSISAFWQREENRLAAISPTVH
ncbi:hypothetical protein L0Y34_01275 [Candidatus Parcubacteria bacterium]|nr:hypothetical protein [Candidatus Parcubacteria bacterium]